MKVMVTAEDIADGVPYSKCECPVALALMRLPIPGEIYVGSYRVSLEDADFPLPDKVCTFIKDFDDGKPVVPFQFELHI